MNVLVCDDHEIKELIQTTIDATIAKLRPERIPLLMNKKRVAEYLGVKISTVNRLMREENLPFRKYGNDFPEFYKPEIDQWLSSRFIVTER